MGKESIAILNQAKIQISTTRDSAQDHIRKDYLDYLRVAAVIAIICIHTSAPFYGEQGAVGSPGWWLANIMDSASRAAVPVFVMISGAVQMNKRPGLGAFYRRTLPRFLIPTLFWNLFYLAFGAIGAYQNPGEAIWTLKFGIVISGGSFYHLWYMSTFLCLLLLVPFVSKLQFGQSLNVKETVALAAILFLFASLYMASEMLQVLKGATFIWLKGVPWFVAYFVLGYWIDKNGDLITIPRSAPLRIAMLLIALGVAANFGAAKYFGVINDIFIFNIYGGLCFAIATLLFLHFWINAAGFTPNNWVMIAAKASFGVYLIHPAFIQIVRWTAPSLQARPLIAIPLTVAIVAAASFATIYILRRSPTLRHLC